jgi:hypothetical protein
MYLFYNQEGSVKIQVLLLAIKSGYLDWPAALFIFLNLSNITIILEMTNKTYRYVMMVY